MTTGRATWRQRRDTPVGKDAVAAAVLSAAAELFAERGPAATTIRDIAERSNVNQGLIFRHFGTKEKLVGAVLDHLARNLADLVDSGVPLRQSEAVDQHWRVMARALLDGYPAGQLQTVFPHLAKLVDDVRPHHSSDLDARLAVANVAAAQLGWRLFGPFLRAATDLEDIPEAELRELINAESNKHLQLGERR